jgi:hypothetical protein
MTTYWIKYTSVHTDLGPSWIRHITAPTKEHALAIFRVSAGPGWRIVNVRAAP